MVIANQCPTEFQIRRFAAKRKIVQSALADLIKVAEELESLKLRDQLAEASRLLADDVFRVVVMGEFSNGKSTLINALLGARVLPSSNSPTTTVLTIIESGSDATYALRMRDGTERQISQEEFRELVAPEEPDKQNPKDVERYNLQRAVVAEIEVARIKYPTAICSEGVVVVDTPGTNDLDTMRQKIAYDYVPNADAAIIVMSAQQPLSSQEMAFITGRILPSDIGRLFFVVNRKDFLKTPQDLDKQSRYVLKHLSEVVDRPRLYYVCSRDALAHRTGRKMMLPPMPMEETGIPEFERALAEFLESSRAATKLERPITTGTRIASDLAAGPIVLRRSAIGLAANDVKRMIAGMEPELVRAKNEHREVISGLRAQLQEEGERILADLRKGLEAVVSTGVAAARNYGGELTKEKIAAAVEQAVGREHSQQIEKAKGRQQEALREHCSRAEKRMQSTWKQLRIQVDVDLSTTVRGSSLSLPDMEGYDQTTKVIAVGGMGALTVATLSTIAFPLVLLGGLCLALFGGNRESQRRQKILDEVVPQIRSHLSAGVQPTLSAFDSEWQRVVESACQMFEEAFTTRIDAMMSELRALGERHKTEQANAEEQRARCDRLQKQLEGAVQTLIGCRWQS